MEKFLIIQTSFIGDVILATAVAEKLHQYYPDSSIDFLLRKGNETLLSHHPFIKTVIIWDKNKNKFKNLLSVIKQVRSEKYTYVINLHRFASSGFITAFSGANNKIGFDKNLFSFTFSKHIKHEIGIGRHEVERNQQLIKDITDQEFSKPKLYPSEENLKKMMQYKNNPYVCIAPTSVWFTKQFPKEKWVELCNLLPDKIIVYLLGAENDSTICSWIKSNSTHKNIINHAGKFTFLESAALMKDAQMNYVNDSAPMHIASAMNAPTTAIFCSTVPSFGFGPLASDSKIVETKEKLSCRPCGLHGHKTCPLKHFQCAYSINIKDIITNS